MDRGRSFRATLGAKNEFLPLDQNQCTGRLDSLIDYVPALQSKFELLAPLKKNLSRLVLTDVDRTVMATEHDIYYLKHDSNGQEIRVSDPRDPSKALAIPWGAESEHIELERLLLARYPNLDWERFDYSEAASMELNLATPPIPETLALLQSEWKAGAGVYALTARLSLGALEGARQWFQSQGVPLAGIIGTSLSDHLQILELPARSLLGHERKALTAVAMVNQACSRYGFNGNVLFIEDKIEALICFAELLVQIAPPCTVELFEVSHRGNRNHGMESFAIYRDGSFVTPTGLPIELSQLQDRKSKSVPYYNPKDALK